MTYGWVMAKFQAMVSDTLQTKTFTTSQYFVPEFYTKFKAPRGVCCCISLVIQRHSHSNTHSLWTTYFWVVAKWRHARFGFGDETLFYYARFTIHLDAMPYTQGVFPS